MESPQRSEIGQPIRFDFVWRRFHVSIAATAAEVREAQALRWEVFRHEWQGLEQAVGLDIDAFDDRADHLLLRDAASGLLVGTFRFIRGVHASDFYSSTEFDITAIVRLPGAKVELGRACLRREWRNNLSVVGLYRGILAYIEASRVRWLFGCSSVNSVDPDDAVRLSRWFHREGHLLDAGVASPLSGHGLVGADDPAAWAAVWQPTDEKRVEVLLPPLLRTYLRAGARLAPHPVHDPMFECIDYLTVFDLERANQGFISGFQRP